MVRPDVWMKAGETLPCVLSCCLTWMDLRVVDDEMWKTSGSDLTLMLEVVQYGSAPANITTHMSNGLLTADANMSFPDISNSETCSSGRMYILLTAADAKMRPFCESLALPPAPEASPCVTTVLGSGWFCIMVDTVGKQEKPTCPRSGHLSIGKSNCPRETGAPVYVPRHLKNESRATLYRMQNARY